MNYSEQADNNKGKGLYLKGNFVNFREMKIKRRRLSGIATRQRSIDFTSLLTFLPNPDEVLTKKGETIEVFNELRPDPHLSACVMSRKSGVKSLKWELEQGDASEEQLNTIKRIFNLLDLNRIISEILDAPLYGYAPLEILWANSEGLWFPWDVQGKPAEWFVFGTENNELRFLTKENQVFGIPLPKKKFLLPRHNATYKNPYGEAILSKVLWPILYKKATTTFWATFTEKYGMPFIYGKQPRNTEEKDTDSLLESLMLMLQDAVAAVPDDTSIEILEPGGKSASADIYDKFISYANSEISKAVIGQTLTTELGNVGSFSASQTHMQVREEIITEDKRLVEQTFNQLIKWFFHFNFGNIKNYPKFSMFKDDTSQQAIEKNKGLSEILKDSGRKLSTAYLSRSHNLEDGDIEETETISQEPASFAEQPGDEALESFIETIEEKDLQVLAQKALKPILVMINKGQNFEDIQEELLKQFPKMNTKDIEKLLGKAIFFGEIWGRLVG